MVGASSPDSVEPTSGGRAAVVAAETLPVLAREAIADLRAHLTYLDERISRYERQLVALVKEHEPARRIQAVAGVGPLTASALTASIASGHEFANGRQFAAWLGWCRGSIPPAAGRGWGASPNAAMRSRTASAQRDRRWVLCGALCQTARAPSMSKVRR